jgi:hypothetical protein
MMMEESLRRVPTTQELIYNLKELSKNYLDNFTTDEIIAIKEKRISESEFISLTRQVKEIMLHFFNIVIEVSRQNTKTAV